MIFTIIAFVKAPTFTFNYTTIGFYHTCFTALTYFASRACLRRTVFTIKTFVWTQFFTIANQAGLFKLMRFDTLRAFIASWLILKSVVFTIETITYTVRSALLEFNFIMAQSTDEVYIIKILLTIFTYVRT
jgi:hypothetical protein